MSHVSGDLRGPSSQSLFEGQIVFETLHDSGQIIGWASARAEDHERRSDDLVDTPLDIRNEALPIHRLPNEILMKIFEGQRLRRMSGRLQLVCRRWKSVMLSTPRFWANLLAGTDLNGARAKDVAMLRQCLSRSGDIPLRRVKIIYIAKLVADLFRCRHRFTALRVDLLAHEDDKCALQELLSAGMQNLCHLRLFESKSADTTPLVCRQDLLPRLHQLCAPMTLVSPATVVGSLRDIQLSGVIPNLDTVVDAVRECPELEELMIFYAIFKALGTHSHNVYLPHLRKVSYHSHNEDTPATVLARITFPTTTSIGIKFSNCRQLASLLSPCSPVFRTSSELNHVLATISFGGYAGVFLCCGHTADRERRRLCADDLYDFFGDPDSQEVFSGFPITTLTLLLKFTQAYGHISLDEVSYKSNIWETFPRMHTLELSASTAPPVWLRCRFVEYFMEKRGDERRLEDMTVAWEVPEASLSALAEKELQKLEAVIRIHHRKGKGRIGTLRLHHFRHSSKSSAPSNPYGASTAGDRAASANPFGGFYEGFVNRMRSGLVGNVVVSDTPIDIGGVGSFMQLGFVPLYLSNSDDF